MGKNRVCYFYDDEVAGLYYGLRHPMKPQRITMTHHLVLGYRLHDSMDVYEPRKLRTEELTAFHTKEFVEFLASAEGRDMEVEEEEAHAKRFGINADCPIFPGLFNFCRIYAGASVDGARKLNSGQYDIAINWAGGLHHGKKAMASGFCYVNDLVLAALELLKVHARVLYVDIDIHHGDGVEEAFYTTDRVMTRVSVREKYVSTLRAGVQCSFHKGYGFYPGTGHVGDIGEGAGRGYSVNVPFHGGVTNAMFRQLFMPTIDKIMDVFDPGAVILQCGADSLAADRLGSWALSIRGHGEAVRHIKSFGRPMLVTGGGGYTKTNVARCWTNETATLLGQELDPKLPSTVYDEYFVSDPTLRLDARDGAAEEHANKPADLDAVLRKVLRNLDALRTAPAAGMREVPGQAALQRALEERGLGTLDEAAKLRFLRVIKEHHYASDDEG